MDRRDFLKCIGIASVFPVVGTAGAALSRQPGTRMLLGEFAVAGFQYHEGMLPDVGRHLACGQQLLVVRDAANPYDPFALRILTNDRHMLGFIPRSQNRIAATLADQGIRLSAGIVAVHHDAAPWERLTISLWAELPAGASAQAHGSEATA